MSDTTLDLTQSAQPVTIAAIRSAYGVQRSATGQHATAVRLTPAQLDAMLASPDQREYTHIQAVGTGYEILGLPVELA